MLSLANYTHCRPRLGVVIILVLLCSSGMAASLCSPLPDTTKVMKASQERVSAYAATDSAYEAGALKVKQLRTRGYYFLAGAAVIAFVQPVASLVAIAISMPFFFLSDRKKKQLRREGHITPVSKGEIWGAIGKSIIILAAAAAAVVLLMAMMSGGL